MLGGEGHGSLGAWLRGVAHDFGESFRDSFKSFTRARRSFKQLTSRTRTSSSQGQSVLGMAESDSLDA